MPIIRGGHWSSKAVVRLHRTLPVQSADAVGRALGSPPGQIWVRLHTLDQTQYAENGSSLGSSELPVFVTVLKREVPSGRALEAEVASLTDVIARAVGRAVSSVHLEYAPDAVNRLAFGGKLVR